VLHNAQRVGFASTRIEYDEPDRTFKLRSTSRFDQLTFGEPPLQFSVLDLSSMLRVSRDGQLRELQSDITVKFGVDIGLHLSGQVQDGLFLPKLRVRGLPGD